MTTKQYGYCTHMVSFRLPTTSVSNNNKDTLVVVGLRGADLIVIVSVIVLFQFLLLIYFYSYYYSKIYIGFNMSHKTQKRCGILSKIQMKTRLMSTV